MSPHVSRKKHTLYFKDQAYAHSKEETILRTNNKLSFYGHIKGYVKALCSIWDCNLFRFITKKALFLSL